VTKPYKSDYTPSAQYAAVTTSPAHCGPIWAEAKTRHQTTTHLFVINTFSQETCSYANQPFIGSENVNLIMAFGNLVALSIQSNI
jgi:hypothetical protein